MKKEVREKVQKYPVFVAADDTEFLSQEECIAYERSLRGSLRCWLAEHCLNLTRENELYYYGTDERSVFVVAPETEEEIIKINQILLLSNNVSPDSILSKDQIGKVIILTFCEDGAIIVERLDDFIDNVFGRRYTAKVTYKENK